MPLWNLTPLRRVKVQVSPSFEVSHLVARPGTIFSFSSNLARFSYIIRLTASDGLLSALAGSRLSGSAPAA